MLHWTEVVRRRQQAAVTAVRNSLPAISVPVGDSPYTAPGWIFEGIFFSCIPDVVYPYDPAVMRYIREFCPDAIPISVRHVYRWSNYNELGHLGEPVVIMRHGIARYVRDPISPVHDFPCEMPAHSSYPRPNYIEKIWCDRSRPPSEVKRLTHDLPGHYLPFDWDFGHTLKNSYDESARWLAQSRRDVDADNNPRAVGAAKPYVETMQAEETATAQQAADQRAYINRDLESYYSAEPSDVELKEKLLGG